MKTFGKRVHNEEDVRAALVQDIISREVGVVPTGPESQGASQLDPISEYAVQLLAIAAPNPAPNVLDPSVSCKVAIYSSWDSALGPRRITITTWGHVMSW